MRCRTATILLLISLPIAAQQPSDFHFVPFGDHVGQLGVQIAADARGPLIVTSFRRWCGWEVLRPDGSGGYAVDFVSPIPAADVDAPTCLCVADVLPAPGPELVVPLSSGWIEIWQLQTNTRLRRFPSGISGQAVAVGDLDGDGVLELVVTGRGRTNVLHADGTVVASLPGFGGERVAIGQMDGDPALEFAVASGQVVDGATLQVQWVYSTTTAVAVQAADVDGDGRDELLAGDFVAPVRCYDVELQQLKYNLSAWPGHTGNLGAVTTANVDADPTPEVLIGNLQWQVLVYDGATGALQQTIQNNDTETFGLAVGDCDGDGVQELVFGTDHGTAKSHLFVHDTATWAQEWASPDYDAPVFGPFVGDFDGDRIDELVVVTASHAAGYQPPHVLVFDPVTYALRLDVTPLQRPYTVTDAQAIDLDADGDLDLLVTNNGVEWLEWVNGVPTTRTRDNSGGMYSFVADANGDGVLDLVRGGYSNVSLSGIPGGAPYWMTTIATPHRFAVGDTDWDGRPDILCCSSSARLVIVDGTTGAVKGSPAGSWTAADALPLPNGTSLLLLGSVIGRVSIMLPRGGDYLPLVTVPYGGDQILGIGTVPGTYLPVLSTSGGVKICDGPTVVWQSYGVGSEPSPHPVVYLPTLTVFVAGNIGCFGFRLR